MGVSCESSDTYISFRIQIDIKEFLKGHRGDIEISCLNFEGGIRKLLVLNKGRRGKGRIEEGVLGEISTTKDF